MILRVLHLAVIGMLVLAAAYVYRIKFDSTLQAERLAKLRGEVRRERDVLAALRAEWGELDNPARIEALARHYLSLRPVAPTQFGSLDRLPDHPPPYIQPGSPDPIGTMIENLEEPETVKEPETGTRSLLAPAAAVRNGASAVLAAPAASSSP